MYSGLKRKYDQYIRLHPFEAMNEVLFNVLMEEIIMFRFKPGQKLKEADIADALNVSRTVVSNAIDNLHNYGLVIKEKSHSPVISPFDIKDYNDLIQVRSIIESAAAEQFVRYASDDDFAFLTLVAQKMERAILLKDYSEFVMLDLEFHKFIIENSKNSYLLHLYTQMSYKIRQYMHIQVPMRIHNDPGFRSEHILFIEQLKKKNPEYAKLAATMHCSAAFLTNEEIEQGYRYALDKIQSSSPPTTRRSLN